MTISTFPLATCLDPPVQSRQCGRAILSLLAATLIFTVSGCGQSGGDNENGPSVAELLRAEEALSTSGKAIPTDPMPSAGSIQWTWVSTERKAPWFLTPRQRRASKQVTVSQGRPLSRASSHAAGGLALFDYDGDGQLDLAQTQGEVPLPEASSSLLLARSTGPFQFEDVTEKSRLTGLETALGTAAADFDNDGFVDLFIAGADGGTLWRNCGDGTFEKHPLPLNLRKNVLGTAAVWADFDGDGLLDLYILTGRRSARLVERERTRNSPGAGKGGSGAGAVATATVAATSGSQADPTDNHPEANEADPESHSDDEPPRAGTPRDRPAPSPDREQHRNGPSGEAVKLVTKKSSEQRSSPWPTDLLLKNLGDGRFEDCTAKSGIPRVTDGPGLSVVVVDFDGDGRLDLYVTHRETRDFLFRNVGGMQFQEVLESVLSATTTADASTSATEETLPPTPTQGHIPSGSRGAVVADYNRDGRFDLMLIQGGGRPSLLMENRGAEGFYPVQTELAIEAISDGANGSGAVFHDFDLDGWPDVFVANGVPPPAPRGRGTRGRHRPHLYVNCRGKRFLDAAYEAGEYFMRRHYGHVVACGDLDRDGVPDLVLAHHDGPPDLLRNDSPREGPIVRCRFVGVGSSRQPLGCRVELRRHDGSVITQSIPAGGSYRATSSDLICAPSGLGTSDLAAVQITWPNGRMEQWSNIPAGTLNTLVEGTGQPVTDANRIPTNSPPVDAN